MMTAPQVKPQNRRVLVVDDNPQMLDVLCEMIADEGYDIIRSVDGATALGALSSGHFDLVITDLHMGRVSGIDILKRAKEQRPATVVIIVTGNISIAPAMEAVWWGVDGYLLKPFTVVDLLESISHCFHKRSLTQL